MRRALALVVLLGCGRHATTEGASPAPAASSAAPTNACGPLECRLFDSPADALLAALESRPLIIGIGEAHALKGSEAVPSSAARFTELLPLLRGRASDLLLELMIPPTGCKKATEGARAAQAPATETHAAGDQGEYVAMGNAARPLGIVPDVLRPSCDDLAAITDAGADAIEVSLTTTRTLAVSQARALLARKDHDAAQAILLYGGALHNDPEPPAETAAFSYGPELSRAVGGRYVAVDLFVPEHIVDNATWRAWPWYPYYDRAKNPGKTTLFRPQPDLYVIIFPAAGP